MKEIKHLNKIFKTSYYKELSEDKCDNIRKEFYNKPSLEIVERDIYLLSKGGNYIKNIIEYYIKDLMRDVTVSTARWSINDFMCSNELLGFADAKITKFTDIYRENETYTSRLETLFRIGSSLTAVKPSNFPYKQMKQILNNHLVPNNNYYDFSCGWGVRLLASLSSRVNYYGTDPNFKLTSKLTEIGELYKEVNKKGNFDIRTQGSEVLVPEWVNTIGLAFSSPPYYDLEDYKHGKQSISEYTDYNDWLRKYWTQTVNNIHNYLVDNGVFMLNVKNGKQYKLRDDMSKIIEEAGFVYRASIPLKNVTRVVLLQNDKHADEDIIIFTKSEDVKYTKNKTLFGA